MDLEPDEHVCHQRMTHHPKMSIYVIIKKKKQSKNYDHDNVFAWQATT